MSVLHSQEVHLVDYLRVLYKRRVFLVVVVLVALGGAVYSTSRQAPVYAASARVMLDNEATLVDFPGIERRSLLRMDTEMHIMRSREVAEHAVRTKLRPGLDRREPEFERLVQALVGATGVEVVRNTYIMEMRVHAGEPEQARRWCEAMAEAYVDLNFQAKKEANAVAAAAIREQINETQEELERAERELMDFKVANNMVSEASKRTEQEASVGAGANARVQAALEKVEYENKYRTLLSWYNSNDFTGAVPADLIPTPIVNDLYANIVRKQMEHRALLGKYTERHPKVVAVAGEVDTLKRSFDTEVRNALALLKKSAELYGTITAAHDVRVEREKEGFLRKNEIDWQYHVLARNVEARDEIYRSLLKKLGELNVSTSIVRNNVRVVERPKASPWPVRPNWRFNLIVGLVFGVGIAVAGVFFLEYLDKTLKTPDDVSRYLALPVLAVVPLTRTESLRASYEPPRLREGDAGGLPA